VAFTSLAAVIDISWLRMSHMCARLHDGPLVMAQTRPNDIVPMQRVLNVPLVADWPDTGATVDRDPSLRASSVRNICRCQSRLRTWEERSGSSPSALSYV
jgi:hypothetical protein